MFRERNRDFKSFISCVFVSFFLLGCKPTIPVKNGAIIADLSGKAGQSRLFSVTVPESIDGLLVQASDNETVTIDLLDEDENSLGQCPSERQCSIDHPSPAKYLIKLSGSAAYSGVSITASWGGETEAVLQNNAEETGIAVPETGVILKSFYLSQTEPLVQVLSEGTGGSTVQILDRFGDTKADCSAGSPCRASQLAQGLYFLRLSSDTALTDASLKVSWGEATGVTLQNGLPKAVSGNAGEEILNTLYFPAGADSLLITTNQTDAFVDILDDSGGILKACGYGACSLEGLSEGLYRVRTTMQSDASSGYITAAWGGPDLSLLSNGGMLKSLSVPGGGGYVFPVYLSDAVESGLAQVGAQSTLELRIYDLLGGVSGNCIEVNLCSFDVHQAGTYFIHVENFTEAAVSFDLAAAWAGAGVHTLADGGDVKRYSMAPTESRIESFYVTDNVMGAMVRPGDHVSAEIITRDYRGDYDVNSSCREQMPCVINSRFGGEPVNPGPYFLRVTNEQQAQIEFNLAMAWAGEEYATLANGVTGKETALQSRDTLLEVISLPPGRKSVAALLVSDAALYVDVFDLGGSLIQSCGMEEPCIFEGTDDFYFLSATNNSEAETSVAVAAAWANESVATLQDGITDQWFSLAPGEVSLQSISVPGDITDALLMFRDIHDSVTALVFDQSGASVAGCGPHYFCSFYTWSFDAEEYFVVFRNESENDSTTFKPVVALASESTYTLANGGFRPEIVLEPNELHIESVFPSAGTGFYGAYVTPYRPSTVMSSFTMMNAHGNPGCYEPFCGFQRTMGAVFISLYNFGNEPQVTALSAAWVNGNQGSLASGSTLSGLTGAVGDQMLHSFVPDEAGQVNITTAESSVEVSVLGPSGDELISCQNACSAQVFQGNPYYFRIRFLDNAESATVTINW